MKKALSLLLITSMLCNQAAFAYQANSFSEENVIPLLGNVVEDGKDFSHKQIDKLPLKLPQKIIHFNLIEAERALVPNILKDQISFWSSPLRIKVRDLKWLIPISGLITTTLILDDEITDILTNDNDPSSGVKDFFDISSGVLAGTALGAPPLFWLIGKLKKDDKLRETGVLQGQALISSTVLFLLLQMIFGRAKPNDKEIYRGKFFVGDKSFPSGHATTAFSLATVTSRQYSEKKWVPFVVYPLAAYFSSGRVFANRHYPGDIAVGALLGYLVGKYVVKKHSEFDEEKEASIEEPGYEINKNEELDKNDLIRDIDIKN